MTNFKKIALGLATSASLGLAFAGNADFTLLNKTGYHIREVYISPTHSKQWGKNRAGKLLKNNASQLFLFSDKAHCVQDLMVVFDDDVEAIWEEFDLCALEKITLRYNRKTGETLADSE